MRVLFLSLIDFKDIEERNLYTDLLREFRSKGHQLYIVSPVERRNKGKTTLITQDGVEILKVAIGNVQKTNVIEKGISTLLLEHQVLTAMKKHWKDTRFDLCLYPTPPITFSKVVQYVKHKSNCKSYLLLKDIFPQNAVDLQMFGAGSILYRFFRRKEKKLYQLSDYIGCMSEMNQSYLLEHNKGLSADKVELCPNSITPLALRSDADRKKNKLMLREKFQLPIEQKIFMYGGNIGRPQGVGFIIQCLERCSKKDCLFVICGTGTDYKKLEDYAKQNGENVDTDTYRKMNGILSGNLLLIPGLKKDDYDQFIQACDVGLIFLDHRFTIPNFPSRLLSYMEQAMPVLACTDANTDIGTVIEQGRFGAWCESNDVSGFEEKIDWFLEHKERMNELGANARTYLEQHYTSEITYEIIYKHAKEREVR